MYKITRRDSFLPLGLDFQQFQGCRISAAFEKPVTFYLKLRERHFLFTCFRGGDAERLTANVVNAPGQG